MAWSAGISETKMEVSPGTNRSYFTFLRTPVQIQDGDESPHRRGVPTAGPIAPHTATNAPGERNGPPHMRQKPHTTCATLQGQVSHHLSVLANTKPLLTKTPASEICGSERERPDYPPPPIRASTKPREKAWATKELGSDRGRELHER